MRIFGQKPKTARPSPQVLISLDRKPQASEVLPHGLSFTPPANFACPAPEASHWRWRLLRRLYVGACSIVGSNTGRLMRMTSVASSAAQAGAWASAYRATASRPLAVRGGVLCKPAQADPRGVWICTRVFLNRGDFVGVTLNNDASLTFERLKEGYEVPDLVGIETEYRHVLVSRHDPFRQRLLEVFDRVTQVKFTERRSLRKRTGG